MADPQALNKAFEVRRRPAAPASRAMHAAGPLPRPRTPPLLPSLTSVAGAIQGFVTSLANSLRMPAR